MGETLSPFRITTANVRSETFMSAEMRQCLHKTIVRSRRRKEIWILQFQGDIFRSDDGSSELSADGFWNLAGYDLRVRTPEGKIRIVAGERNRRRRGWCNNCLGLRN
jgi:hypothetical protein